MRARQAAIKERHAPAAMENVFACYDLTCMLRSGVAGCISGTTSNLSENVAAVVAHRRTASTAVWNTSVAGHYDNMLAAYPLDGF